MNIKKFFPAAIALSILVAGIACIHLLGIQLKPEPEDLASDVSYKFYPIAGAQVGNANKKTIATIPCEITNITANSVILKALNSYSPWVVSITLVKPVKFCMNTGDKTNVVATQWSGSYEVGWTYKLE